MTQHIFLFMQFIIYIFVYVVYYTVPSIQFTVLLLVWSTIQSICVVRYMVLSTYDSINTFVCMVCCIEFVRVTRSTTSIVASHCCSFVSPQSCAIVASRDSSLQLLSLALAFSSVQLACLNNVPINSRLLRVFARLQAFCYIFVTLVPSLPSFNHTNYTKEQAKKQAKNLDV